MQIEVYGESHFDYLVYLPKNYEANKKYPLMLFLHGVGECGDDLSLLKVTGVPKILDKDVDYKAIIVSPQCKKNRSWNSNSDKLFEFLQWAIKKYNADENAVSVTGLSMGAFGTWQLIADHSETFSAAAPICGGWAVGIYRAINLPIRIYHGEQDNVVNVQNSKDAYQILKNNGAKEVELFLYPECNHNSWTKTYERTDLLDWLINKRRK